MNQDQMFQTLRACQVFHSLSDQEIQALANIGERTVVKAEETVFGIEDSREKHFFVVLDGEFLLRLRTNETRAYTPGMLFGEIGIFTESYRMGSIWAKVDSALIQFDKQDLLNPERLDSQIAIKVISCLTQNIIGYLSSYLISRINIPAEELIKEGEGDTIEFKNSPFGDNRRKIRETVGAFLNAKGGTILIGVQDDGSIPGVQVKDNQDFDKINRNLYNAIMGQLLDRSAGQLINIDKEQIGDRVIIRIDCAPSPQPVFFWAGQGDTYKELFFIRTSNSNTSLEKVSEIINAIQNSRGTL